MKILVTGASGFIGHNVIDLLQKMGHEVFAVSSKVHSATEKLNRNWVNVDLLNLINTEQMVQTVRPEGLIHLAWYSAHNQFWTAPENYLWSTASINLLQSFHRVGGKKVVFAGTCAEYEWSNQLYKEETTSDKASSIYGRSKGLTRQYAQSFCLNHRLDFAWGRVFFPYGPGEPKGKLLASVLNSLAREEEVKCSHGKQIRDFIHVSDVAAAFVHLLLNPNANGVFNIGSGQPTRLADVIELCTSHFERTKPINFGAIKSDSNEPQFIVADTKKINEIGWLSMVPLSDGIASYASEIKASLLL